MFNSFGNIFRLTSFGESHGPGVGGVIDGFPAGIKIDMDFVQQELNRRRPGQSLLTTSRKEPDTVEFLSGIQRAMYRDGASEEQVRARIAAQMDDEEKRRRADFTVVNDGVQLLIPQLNRIVEQLKTEKFIL